MTPVARRGWQTALITVAVALLSAAGVYQAARWVTGLLYPLHHRELVAGCSGSHDLDTNLVAAVIRTESRWRAHATSRSGARGLMQIMPETAAWAAERMGLGGFEPDQLYDPAVNIRLGCWYLHYLIGQFGGDWVTALAAYNGGDHNVRRWLRESQWTGEAHHLDQIPFPETRAYVKNVLRDYRIYIWLYGNRPDRTGRAAAAVTGER